MKYLEYIFEEIDGEETGIFDISLVESPAHGAEFISMSEGETVLMSALDVDKRLAIGPVMMPGELKKSPLRGRKGTFSAETIGKLMADYLKRSGDVSVNHDDKVADCHFTQHWQVNRAKGINAGYGFDSGQNKVPDGTWMGSMYIGNDDVWMDCKKGDFKGFSPTAKLRAKEVQMSSLEAQMAAVEALQEELFKTL